MDMLEDYLRAVSRLLPRAKRDDITAELRDEILTRIEVRESELGRKLSDNETEQLLRDFGHPIVVAARYRDGPQYSVGPALYPYWIFAVRFAVVLEICISAAVFIGRMFSGAHIGDAFGQAIGSGLTGVMTLIGFATVAAWLIERKGITIEYFNTWRVRDLRFLDFAAWEWGDISERIKAMTTAAAYEYPREHGWGFHSWSRRQSSAGRGVALVTGGGVFILWWIGVISFGLRAMPADFGNMPISAGGLANVDLAALKAAIFWPVLAYFIALIGLGVVVLTWPRGVRMRGAIDIALGTAAMVLAAWVWGASPIAAAVRVDSVAEMAGRIGAFFANPIPVPLDLFISLMLVFTAVGGFFRALGGVWELLVGAPRFADDD